MNDLLMVTAFCDNEKKLKSLENIINILRIQNFDILLSTHSIIPNRIQKMVDIYIYDKENLILSDDEIRYKLFFKNENFTVHSNLATPTSSIYAGRKLESLGINLAKHLGYKKIHKIEYDLLIESIDEIKNNSQLLNVYDVIYYTLDGTGNSFMPDSFWSLNLDKTPNFYNTYIQEDKMKFFYQNSALCSEDIIQNEFKTINKKIKKISELNDQKIYLSNERRAKWFVPIFNYETDSLFFFGYNETDREKEILIKTDSVEFLEKIPPRVWKLFEISKDISCDFLTISLDSKETIKLIKPLENPNFRKYNYIEYKKF